MRIKVLVSILSIFSLIVLLSHCIVKQTDENIDPTTNTAQTDLSTIPGNNYFSINQGKFSIVLNGGSIVTYLPESGRCDISSDGYVITLKSTKPSVAFASIYFLSVPATGTYSVVPYKQTVLDATNAWATITTVNDGKTWRAISGNIAVSVNSSTGLINASFDNLAIQNLSAITDTAATKASASVYCK